MSRTDEEDGTLTTSPAPFVLRELIADVPLVGDEDDEPEQSSITCVEHWSGNLYIGTSAGVLLHYVSLPPDEDDHESGPSWIQASRRTLPHAQSTFPAAQTRAVKQILILPRANKAFILCHGLVTIYTLPELTPTLASASARLTNCAWLGGLDNDVDRSASNESADEVFVICQESRMRIVKVTERLSQVREIGLGGCMAIARRGDIACVADATSYSLLDIVEQQRIHLFDILPTNNGMEESNPERDPTTEANTFPERHSSLAALSNTNPEKKSSSNAASGKGLEAPSSPASKTTGVKSHPGKSNDSLLASPLIISPTSERFLLVTGTSTSEPAVGLIVNLDGEIRPPTLEFSSFPYALCLHEDRAEGSQGPRSGGDDALRHLIAVVTEQAAEGSAQCGLEIHRLRIDTDAQGDTRSWLSLTVAPGQAASEDIQPGIRSLVEDVDSKILNVPTLLATKQLKLGLHGDGNAAGESGQRDSSTRETAELRIMGRLANFRSNVVAWSHASIWTVVANPEIMQTENRLGKALHLHDNGMSVDRTAVEDIIERHGERMPSNELDFYTLGYVRQQCSLLLFADLLSQACQDLMVYDRDVRVTTEALVMGEIDPRVLLAMVPSLKEEIIEGANGLWVPGGLQRTFDGVARSMPAAIDLVDHGQSGRKLLQLVKDYLMTWRRKKGLASVTDEEELFQTVDAALLRLLLIQDADSPRGPATKGSVRAQLNGVLDHGVDCFDRAVRVLESSQRLYLLSRLYQSRKMSQEVLTTWIRMLEGEHDAGGEFVNGEATLRRYLTQVSDAHLVEEYGSWLARRDPKLGVQVFADRSSKIRFEPKQAVKILQERAPEAVKIFLEHLVFDKNMTLYANELITYYLETVLLPLEDSASFITEALAESYTTYRILPTPKPTYLQYIEHLSLSLSKPNNERDWWTARLRLLQILSSNQDYSMSTILSRIDSHSEQLTPEAIVLASKQGQHAHAIYLLVHGLGDYDTAVSYCVRGGTSIYTATPTDHPTLNKAEQQELFQALLQSFLSIPSPTERLTHTSELLERFGPWFDPLEVVEMIPNDWSVDVLCAFIECSLRKLVTERNETAILKALCGKENLESEYTLVEKLVTYRPRVQAAPVDSA